MFFSMFFVSQKIHIRRSPNGIKTYREYFLNICDFWELESPQTEAHTAHKTPGRARGPWRVVVGCALLERRLELYFGRKEAYIQKKNRVKISAQSELRISGNIRNGFRPDLRNAKQKRIEREIQSRRGSRPFAAMETKGQRGNPSPT